MGKPQYLKNPIYVTEGKKRDEIFVIDELQLSTLYNEGVVTAIVKPYASFDYTEDLVSGGMLDSDKGWISYSDRGDEEYDSISVFIMQETLLEAIDSVGYDVLKKPPKIDEYQ